MLSINRVSRRFVATLTLIFCATFASAGQKTPGIELQAKQAVKLAYAKLPLAFEPNHGQAPQTVKFVSHGAGYSLFITGDEAVFVFSGKQPEMLRLKLAGRASAAAGMDQLAGTTDYFLGNDSSKWVTNVPQFGRVALNSVLKGIDLHYYGNSGKLEYDYLVAPGADPSEIAIQLTGAKKLSVDKAGNLLITLASGTVSFQKPFAYQEFAGKRREIAALYKLQGDRLSFKLGKYDKTQPLVIDPVFNYLTYLGGTNSSSGTAIAIDSSGLAYVAGNTSTTNFALNANDCSDVSCGVHGGQDVFVARISSGGNQIQKLSIVGGAGTDAATGIAVGTGSPATAFVVGNTSSTDFPAVNAFQGTLGGGAGQDAFLFSLANTGSSLSYSTYIGGTATDSAYGVAVNTSKVYVAGDTQSSGLFSSSAATDFHKGIVGSLSGASDAFLAKFDTTVSGTAGLLYATYFGGTTSDSFKGIVVPAADTAYVVGTTNSSDFTTSTLTGSPFSATLSGPFDAVTAKFDTRGTFELDPANDPNCDTGPNPDVIVVTTKLNHGLQPGEWVVISGVTASANIVFDGVHKIRATPTTKTFTYVDAQCHGAPSSTNNEVGVVTDGVSKVGTSLLQSTYVGGSGTDDGLAIAVNAAGNAFIVGSTDSPTAATFPDDANNIQSSGFGGGTSDGFIARLAADATAVNFSAYLGGADTDVATAVAVDPLCAASCDAWVAGYTRSLATDVFNGPTAFGAGAGTPDLKGGQDAFVVRVNGAGNGLTFGSYIGGMGAGTVEAINGVALNASLSTLYIAGTTDSSDLPVSAAGAQNLQPFSPSAFAGRLSAFNNSDPGFSFTNHPPSAGPLVSGDAVTYTWDVVNTSAASNITVDLPMPNDGSGNDFINVTSATPNCAIRVGSASGGPGGITCQLVNQGGAGSQVLTVNGTLNSAISACVTQPCASFSLTPRVASVEVEGPGNPVTDPTATTSNVAQAVTLDVSTSSADSDVTGGQSYKDTQDTSIDFTLNVTNPAADATDVNISLVMAYPANFVVDTPDAGCTDTPGTQITCNMGMIGAGATATKHVIGHYTTIAAPATLTHTLTATPATASATQKFIVDPAKNSGVQVNVNYLGPTADLAVSTLSVVPNPTVNEGATVTMTANYINNGPDTTNADLKFTLTPTATAIGPLPAGCSQATNIVTCTLGSLTSGATGSRVITAPAPLALASASAAFSVKAEMFVTSAGVVDTVAANNSVTQATTVERHTNLTLGTLTGPASVSQHANVAYSIPLNNASGPNNGQNVLVRFAVTGAGTYSLSGSSIALPATGSCSLVGGNVDCTVSNVTTAGTTVSVTITPDATLLGTTLASANVSTTASIVSAASIDAGVPSGASNAVLTAVQRRTTLNLSGATMLPNPTSQTGNIVFHVLVDNTSGTDDAQHVTLTYSFPDGFTFGSINAGSCGTITASSAICDIGAVTTATPVSVNLTFTPTVGFVPTTAAFKTLNAQITNTASTAVVDSGAGTKTTAGLSTDVQRRSNLGLTTYTVSPTPNANDGVPLTYTINGGNAGPDTAEGVQVVIDFTAVGATGFNLGTDTAPGGCLTTAATQVTCSIGQLTNGSTFSFTVQVTPPGTFLGASASKSWTSTATVSGQVVDGTAGNNALNRNVNIQAQADLFGTIAESADPATLSSAFAYIINVGEKATVVGGGTPTPANNARVSFTMPTNGVGATLRTFTASAIIPGNFTCTVGGLPPTFPIAPGTTVVCELLSTTLVPGGATEQVVFIGDPAFSGGVSLAPTQATNTLAAQITVDTNGPTVIENNAADNSPNITTTLQRNADMSIGVITETPDGAATGATYIEGTNTYVVLSIPINNAGPDAITAANGINLASTILPAGTTFNAAFSDPSCSLSAGVVTCTNVAVPAGGGIVINVALTPPSSPAANSTFITTWNVSTGAPSYNDPNTGNNNGNATVNIQRQGNVGVSISPVIPGIGYVVAGPNFSQQIVYDVTVSATSPGANASNVPVSVVLPSGTSGITTNIVAPNSCTPAGNTVSCTIQTLNAGTSMSFQVSGLPSLPITQSSDPGVTAQVSVNPAALTLIDQNAADDSDTSAGIPLRGETNLQVTVTSPPTPNPNFSRPSSAVAPTTGGSTLTYTITVTALATAGMHPVEGLRIDHVIPAGTSLISVNSAGLGCSSMPCTPVGNLALGSPQTITVVVGVPSTAVPTQTTSLGYQVVGTGFSQLTIAQNDTETAGNNNNNNLTASGAGVFTSVAEQSSDMTVSVPNPGLLQPGNTAHFNITVSNVSNLNPSTGTTVTIPISAAPVSDSSVASATPSQGSCGALSGGGTASASITCNLGAIAVGANATIDLAVTPALPGQVQITPTVTVTNVDPNPGNDSATATLLTGNTPPGVGPIAVQPANSTTGVAVPGTVITFTGAGVQPPGGNTTADVVPGSSPAGFKPPFKAYSIGTTAVFDPTFVPMCVTFTATVAKPERVRFFANGSDVTIAAPAPASYTVGPTGGTICGNVNVMTSGGPGSVNVVIAEPQNSTPTAVATNTSSSTSGKGLTGAGVTLDATASFDDNDNCTVGLVAQGNKCADMSNALLTWTGQFTDGNQKQVQCSGVGGPTNLSAVPPLVPAGSCLKLDVSVPFGQQVITLQITDPYGQTSAVASTQINSTATSGGSTSGAVTLNAGQSATYAVNATSAASGVTTISIMSITPATTTISCSVTPSTILTTSSTLTLTVGCSTQAPIFGRAEPVRPGSEEAPMLAGILGITALPLVGMLLLPGRRNKRMKVMAILGLIMMLTLFMGACGGGNGENFGGSATLQSAGTPPGTYTITLGATNGAPVAAFGGSSTKTLTLVVQ